MPLQARWLPPAHSGDRAPPPPPRAGHPGTRREDRWVTARCRLCTRRPSQVLRACVAPRNQAALARDGGKKWGKQTPHQKRRSYGASESAENPPAFRFKTLPSLAPSPEPAPRALEFLKGGANESSRPAWALSTLRFPLG